MSHPKNVIEFPIFPYAYEIKNSERAIESNTSIYIICQEISFSKRLLHLNVVN